MTEIMTEARAKSLEDARFYLKAWANNHDSDSRHAAAIAAQDLLLGSDILGKVTNELQRGPDIPYLQLQVGGAAITRFVMTGQYYEDTHPAESGELEPGATLALHSEVGGSLKGVRGLWLGDFGHYVHTTQIAETLTQGGTLDIVL